MRMTVLAGLTTAMAAFAPSVAQSASTQVFKGRATSEDGKFRYGAVTVKRSGARVTRIEIKSVTASCSFGSGLRLIVYNPKSRDIDVVGGGPKVSKGRMAVSFRPDKTVEDQITSISLRFSGTRVTGKFNEVGPCTDRGKLSAKR